ncbi:MAG: TerB family tellurite resistance protein [Phenylobacterium sp.]
MGFWNRIAALAVRRPEEGDCDCPPGPPGADPAFSTAVTALGAKLAKADGRARVSEFDAFAEVFSPEAAAERNVQRLYELARQTTHGFEGYARQLARRYRNCPTLLEDVLDGLFHIAAADGAISEEEDAYLERVAELFGFGPLSFRRIRAIHLGRPEDDPYLVLDAPRDVSDEDLRALWRRRIAEAHPDRVRAMGLPEEYLDIAHAKASALNAAYDAIRRERMEMAGVRG